MGIAAGIALANVWVRQQAFSQMSAEFGAMRIAWALPLRVTCRELKRLRSSFTAP